MCIHCRYDLLQYKVHQTLKGLTTPYYNRDSSEKPLQEQPVSVNSAKFIEYAGSQLMDLFEFACGKKHRESLLPKYLRASTSKDGLSVSVSLSNSSTSNFQNFLRAYHANLNVVSYVLSNSFKLQLYSYK